MNKLIPKLEFLIQSLFTKQEFCPHCRSKKTHKVAKKYRIIKIQLGFSSEFFQRNLPNYGLKILGFYDSWQNFPNEKLSKSGGDIVLLAAEKIVV